jgi:hypothetical protein
MWYVPDHYPACVVCVCAGGVWQHTRISTVIRGDSRIWKVCVDMPFAVCVSMHATATQLALHRYDSGDAKSWQDTYCMLGGRGKLTAMSRRFHARFSEQAAGKRVCDLGIACEAHGFRFVHDGSWRGHGPAQEAVIVESTHE